MSSIPPGNCAAPAKSPTRTYRTTLTLPPAAAGHPGHTLRPLAPRSVYRLRHTPPQRGCVLQPKVARAGRATLGRESRVSQPQRGCVPISSTRPQPRWGWVLANPVPKVAAQPWAGGRNPVGILIDSPQRLTPPAPHAPSWLIATLHQPKRE